MIVSNLTPARLLDPLFIVLATLGVALWLIGRRKRNTGARRRPRWGLRLAWLAWGTHWLFATPRFAFWLFGSLEMPPIDVAAALEGTPPERCVMVVLTGGTMTPPPRSRAWRPELLAGSSLPRAIGAARVYHERPPAHVIVTGRAEPWQYKDDTANAMADVMVAFGVPRRRVIIDPLARDTRQNALFSGAIARGLGAEKIVVVTSAVHMPRAVREFERIGIRVIAAPVDHRHEEQEGIESFVPSITSMLLTGQAIHEVLGRFKP